MNIHHAIDYIEITVDDVARSKAFYAVAFGWTFNDYGPDYAGIVGRDGEVGGLTKGEAHGGSPLVILYSNDLDTTLVGVRAAGANITQEPYAFPGGRRFHFEDPSGNELAVWANV
jgi:predicted enzyme related to lactoylglutathione lyase